MMNKKINSESSGGLIGAIRRGIEKRKSESGALVFDLFVFFVGLLFARCHVLFGAYPLGVAFVAAGTSGIWISLIGVVLGSLSLGKVGIVHALIAAIVVVLRVIISGGEAKTGGGGLFREPLILRLSSAVIGAFIGAVYELLLGGFILSSVLYAISSCLLVMAFTFVFSNLYTDEISFSSFFFGSSAIFSGKGGGRVGFSLILFQISSLVLLFFISYSLKDYNVFGINFSYVFSAVASLFAAKRFGAIRALAVGFVTSFGISGTYSVAFALVGLVAGVLFPIGFLYAVLGSAAVLSAWSAYSGGLVGFLSCFPEFISGAAIFFPFYKNVSCETRDGAEEDSAKLASDAVGTLALSHRGNMQNAASLSASLVSVAAILRSMAETEAEISPSEIEEVLPDAIRSACIACPNLERCKSITPAPCIEKVPELAAAVRRRGTLSPKDTDALAEYCTSREYLIGALSAGIGSELSARQRERKLSDLSEEYEIISKMVGEASLAETLEYEADKPLTGRISEKLGEISLSGGSAIAIGERKPRFIVAGVDECGERVSSPKLKAMIEAESGLKLGTPEFMRRGAISIFDCRATEAYEAEFAYAKETAPGSHASGDSVTSFQTPNGYSYSLISDGMGSGSEAAAISSFSVEFLKLILSSSVSETTALHALNRALRRRREEASVTVDMFRVDLMTGEAQFIKSGAAASYVKRGDSLFRIRSETVPIGVLSTIDSERIRVELKPGDYVIMISDGISQTLEDSAWLSELLSKPVGGQLSEYADAILAAARENSKSCDDMSVAVTYVTEKRKA